jgi:hypothetical protein
MSQSSTSAQAAAKPPDVILIINGSGDIVYVLYALSSTLNESRDCRLQSNFGSNILTAAVGKAVAVVGSQGTGKSKLPPLAGWLHSDGHAI